MSDTETTEAPELEETTDLAALEGSNAMPEVPADGAVEDAEPEGKDEDAEARGMPPSLTASLCKATNRADLSRAVPPSFAPLHSNIARSASESSYTTKSGAG